MNFHFPALTGLNKAETAEKHGEAQVQVSFEHFLQSKQFQ